MEKENFLLNIHDFSIKIQFSTIRQCLIFIQSFI